MSVLQLPIEPSEFATAWADSLASLMSALHQAQGGHSQQTVRLMSLTRELCAALDNGHSCLQQDFLEKNTRIKSPVIVSAQQALTQIAPLVLEKNRLYLYRYWWDEYRLAQALKSLNHPTPTILTADDLASLTQGTLAKQAQAIQQSLQSGLTVITGGPGTGKTFTLVRILLALLKQNTQLRVALAAPTGKAAARMQEALRQSLEKLSIDKAVSEQLPKTAFTLHRLLGMGHNTPPKFNAQHPLDYDLIIVDEASMIDLRMASQLVTAIAPQARLILLGDANQLAAVEAGAVLAEIGKAQTLKANCVHLTESKRFEGVIGDLAEAVCQGNSAAALQIAQQDNNAIFYHPLEQPDATAKKLFQGYQAFVKALQTQQPISQIIQTFDSYRVLCAVREGAYGVNSINQRLSALLQKELSLAEESAIWYHGRPIMVTKNDYSLDVFNGDIGITLAEEDGFYVYFPTQDQQHRRIAAARLAYSETALALTIHKSQGSEFSRVAVVLPKEDSAILSRQLLYTGITRAKHHIHLWAMEHLFIKAIEQQTQRAAGLHDKIDAK
ncbi:MAG: exodeoxyribonuclease V subunit alpha [Pseudomonadales bacterium]|nr:exodeoxyribonuclease V subunit alpha [Pseudomonadales bacterium]MCB1673532.1 exodeoxyribonuclease V subunit alpha [Pseudomonadales bacterium]